MRRIILGTLVLLGIGVSTPSAHAQLDGFSDPFFLYYGFYLPRQAAIAAQPGPEVSINALSAARQTTALTERAGLYDPIQPLGAVGYDPARPFDRSGARRRGQLVASGITNTNINGAGPAGFYGRTQTYFPGLKTGRPTPRSAGNYAGASVRGGSNYAQNAIRGQMSPYQGVPGQIRIPGRR